MLRIILNIFWKSYKLVDGTWGRSLDHGSMTFISGLIPWWVDSYMWCWEEKPGWKMRHCKHGLIRSVPFLLPSSLSALCLLCHEQPSSAMQCCFGVSWQWTEISTKCKKWIISPLICMCWRLCPIKRKVAKICSKSRKKNLCCFKPQ